MKKVAPKKHLGQHFLIDKEVTERVAQIIAGVEADELIEIGPGMGVLTEKLYPVWQNRLHCIEIDTESVAYLKKAPWAAGLKVTCGDFLKLSDSEIFNTGKTAVIGNYPYNISTQIAFKVMEQAEKVVFFGGMFQKEVAARFCATHGNKEYGITSVLLQALFDCKYLFSVDENAFSPPPKVKSGVMAAHRRKEKLPCSYKNLLMVVKTAFNQRRKVLSNGLKPLTSSRPAFQIPEKWKTLRAEQLSVTDFIDLTVLWEHAA